MFRFFRISAKRITTAYFVSFSKPHFQHQIGWHVVRFASGTISGQISVSTWRWWVFQHEEGSIWKFKLFQPDCYIYILCALCMDRYEVWSKSIQLPSIKLRGHLCLMFFERGPYRFTVFCRLEHPYWSSLFFTMVHVSYNFILTCSESNML